MSLLFSDIVLKECLVKSFPNTCSARKATPRCAFSAACVWNTSIKFCRGERNGPEREERKLHKHKRSFWELWRVVMNVKCNGEGRVLMWLSWSLKKGTWGGRDKRAIAVFVAVCSAYCSRLFGWKESIKTLTLFMNHAGEQVLRDSLG